MIYNVINFRMSEIACFFAATCIFVIHPDLSQDGNVNHDLQEATDDKLRRGFTDIKVCRFEDIATGPHQDHLEAKKSPKPTLGHVCS
jgi:hypothetical protein